MFYIDNDSGVTVMPPVSAQRSAIVRWFSEGDGNNVITWPGMDWFNIVQAELLNTLEEAGIQPDKTKLNQLALSIKAIMSNNALLIKNNLSEIKTAGASAQRTARENLDIYDASLNKKGLVQLTSATDSPSETLAATAKAVKIAMDNANARLAKDRNGADIPNKPLFIQNIISTHNGVDNLFNQYIQDAREGRKDYSVHRITLDDAIADGLYRRICYVTNQPWSPEAEKAWRDGLYRNAPNKESADEEYGCIPKKSGGAYLSRVLIEAAMTPVRDIPILRFEAPDDFESLTPQMRHGIVQDWCEQELLPLLDALSPLNKHVLGEDFARRGDLTVFVPLAITPDLRKRECFRVELRNVTYDQQRQILLFILSRLPRFTGAAFDATGNGGYLAEAARLIYGPEMIDCVNLTASWYQEWMPKLKGEFEAQNITIARHQTTLDDLLHIRVDKGIPQIDKGRTKDEGGKGRRHGDFAVALCMAVRASYMNGFVIDEDSIQALPPRHRGDDVDNDDFDDYHQFERGGW